MKKIILAVVGAAVLAVAGAAGYMVYTQKAEAKAFEVKMADAIASLAPITVYEREELPAIEEEFSNVSDVIDVSSVTPDISDVYTSEPGEYEVVYTFRDVKGEERTATVPCIVKPQLAAHVTGLQNISINAGETLPSDADCTYDEYIDSVTLNTEGVDNTTAGVYDISYTLIGADGEMETVDGYTCTVKAVAPSPTPSPIPSPTPKPKASPKPTEKPKKKEATTTPPPEVGHVENTETTAVETGDENNIAALAAMILACLGSAAGVAIYWKKKKTATGR